MSDHNPVVFISYSRADREFVKRLVGGIEKRLPAVEVLYDQQFHDGDFVAKLGALLERADAVIAVLSPDYFESDWGKAELNIAFKQQTENTLRLIPILAKHCKVPKLISGINHVDCSTNYEAGLSTLVQWLSTNPRRSPTPVAPERQPALATQSTERSSSAPGPLRVAWRYVLLPQLRLVMRWRPDAFGLAAPKSASDRSPETNEERAWWEDNLYKIIRRALSMGLGRSLPLTIYLGFPLVFLLLVWALVPGRLSLSPALVLAAMLAVDALAVGTCFAAFISLRAQPPDRYADIVLSGRQPTDVFRILAWEIGATIDFFIRETASLHGVLPPLAELRGHDTRLIETVNQHRADLSANLPGLKSASPTFQHQIQRLLALKGAAAAVLGIQSRQLCDHIVQYSPTLHYEYFNKYIANWAYILDATKDPASNQELVNERAHALARENRRMLDKVERVRKAQRDLFHYDDLHSFVHALAVQQSMSEATLAYARAISHVAATTTTRDAASAAADDAIAGRKTPTRRLRFLHRKQHAYPGFDLHLTCRQLCSEHEQQSRATGAADEADRARRQGELLAAIADKVAWPQAPDDASQATLDLKKLRITAETYFERSREAIAHNFGALAIAWFDYKREPDAKRAIVVFDYSKTVRQALKTGLKSVGLPRPSGGFEPPLICVLNGEGQREHMAMRMVHELTEDTDYWRSTTLGNEKQIASILGPKPRIMVVIGVEAFDDSGAVVHWRGALDHVARLEQAFRDYGADLKCAVVAVAGGYKRSYQPLAEVTSLLKYHLRHVEISRGRWHYLITDIETRERDHGVDPHQLPSG